VHQWVPKLYVIIVQIDDPAKLTIVKHLHFTELNTLFLQYLHELLQILLSIVEHMLSFARLEIVIVLFKNVIGGINLFIGIRHAFYILTYLQIVRIAYPDA